MNGTTMNGNRKKKTFPRIGDKWKSQSICCKDIQTTENEKKNVLKLKKEKRKKEDHQRCIFKAEKIPNDDKQILINETFLFVFLFLFNPAHRNKAHKIPNFIICVTRAIRCANRNTILSELIIKSKYKIEKKK